MLSTLRPLTRQFTNRVTRALPTACALCGMGASTLVCEGCHAQFFSQQVSRCPQCAIALPYAVQDTHTRCGTCLKQAPAFDATVVAADYTAPIDQLVLALKFGGQLALASLFAQLLHTQMQPMPHDDLPSLLTLVPLGAQRLIERGFNQALEIARPLARAFDIPLHAKLAVRVRDTAAQSSLQPDDRRKNIRNAFTVLPQAIDRIHGAHIGIVDDVMTTGETLNELAATLKRFGAARVTNLVFARSPH